MKRLAVVLIALVVAASAAVARAQRSTSFDAEQFHPSATSQGYLGVDGAFVAPHLGFSAGLWLTYGHDPLVLRSSRGLAGELIVRQLAMDLTASFAVLDRLELGVELPFVPYQLNDRSTTSFPQLRGAGLGDLALELKGLLWSSRAAASQRLALAAVVGAGVPTGDANSFMGEGAASGRFRLVAEWRSRFLSAALNLGVVVRSDHQLFDLHVGSQLTWGAALAAPLPRGFALVGEVRGLVGIALPKGASLSSAEAPSELAAGVRWSSRLGLAVDAAVGVGLSRGYGTPDRARAIVGLRYTTPARRAAVADPDRDSDGDGIADRLDRCPQRPGPGSNDGCPLGERDSDGDGVLDAQDRCPDQFGPRENGGCPDPDSDGDGVPDRLDQCPLQIGVRELGGCPRPDRDHDGVPDDADRCPDKPGPQENQGCPDFDSDGDGFVDRLDKCPFEPETWNGVDDDDGCPDQPAALVNLVGDKIVLSEPLLFDKDGAVVDKRSFKLLGVVAHLLRVHQEILKLRVEGHMDGKTAPLAGLELSRARAAAVRRWLIDEGHVEGRRLTAQGFGADRPIADNRDFIGRAKNRRIELVIMQKLDQGP